MEETKELTQDQQEVNELAEQIKGLTPQIINSVFSGKRPEGMNYMVYRALRKTLQDKTKQYLNGNLEFLSKDIRKQVIKTDDTGNKTVVYTGDIFGTKFVKGNTYVKSKNKENEVD